MPGLSLTTVRGFAPYLSGLLSLALNAVLVWPLLAREVAPDLVGALAAGLAVPALAAPAVAAGVHEYVVRHCADPDPLVRHETSQAAVDWVLLLVTGGAVVAAGLCAVSPLAAACVLLTAATAASMTVTGLSRGLDRAGAFASLTLLGQSVSLATAGAALVLTRSVPLALTCGAGVLLLASLVHLPALQRLRRPGWSARRLRSTTARALRFSVPLVPHLVLVVVVVHGVRLVVSATQGLPAAAAFQFAAMLGGLPVAAVVALNGYWAVRAFRRPGLAEVAEECRRYGVRLALCALALTVVVGLVGVLLVPAWVPGGYPVLAITAAVACFLPAPVLQALADVQSTLALKAGRASILSVATACGAAVTLGAAALLGGAGPGTGLGIVAGGLAVSLGLLVRAAVCVGLMRSAGLKPVLPLPMLLSVGASGVLSVAVLGTVAGGAS